MQPCTDIRRAHETIQARPSDPLGKFLRFLNAQCMCYPGSPVLFSEAATIAAGIHLESILSIQSKDAIETGLVKPTPEIAQQLARLKTNGLVNHYAERDAAFHDLVQQFYDDSAILRVLAQYYGTGVAERHQDRGANFALKEPVELGENWPQVVAADGQHRTIGGANQKKRTMIFASLVAKENAPLALGYVLSPDEVQRTLFFDFRAVDMLMARGLKMNDLLPRYMFCMFALQRLSRFARVAPTRVLEAQGIF